MKILKWKTWAELENEIGLPKMGEYFDKAFASFEYRAEEKLLDRAFIQAHPDTFRFRDDCVKALFEAEDEIYQSTALHAAACFLRYAIFEHKKAYEGPYLRDFYPAVMGEKKGMFPMVIYCANAIVAYGEIARRGLDVRDVSGNFASMASFANGYHASTGHWGLSGCGWNVICASEYLNTVATLRFAPAVIVSPYTVYHHAGSHAFVCLAGEGIECSADGLLLHDNAPDFVTKVDRDGETLTAHPVSKEGIIQKERITIRLDEWTQVLGRGDTVLEYHIPTAPGYVPQNVVSSMRKALDYFACHFPELNIRGFWCYSWLYCPQIEELMAGKASGIADVFRMLRHVPVESGPDCFHPFVFDASFDTPVEQLPEKTSLQRAIKKARMDGKFLCAGGVMLPLKEFEQLEVEYA